MRTDTTRVGVRVGELDGRETARARELAGVVNDVAPADVTTTLRGERWSKLAVNCMATPLAGLSGLGSGEVRSEPVARRIAIAIAAEVVRVGRASGYEIEPIYGITAQRFVDAVEGRGLADVERDMAARAPHPSGGRPSARPD